MKPKVLLMPSCWLLLTFWQAYLPFLYFSYFLRVSGLFKSNYNPCNEPLLLHNSIHSRSEKRVLFRSKAIFVVSHFSQNRFQLILRHTDTVATSTSHCLQNHRTSAKRNLILIRDRSRNIIHKLPYSHLKGFY